MLCLVTQSCLTLCDPMDCSLPGSSVHGDSPGKNTGVGCHALLQGIFPTHRSNPGLPHCSQILYCLSHQGSPKILEWVAYPFFRGSSQPRNRTGVSCIAGRFFTSWAIQEASNRILYYIILGACHFFFHSALFPGDSFRLLHVSIFFSFLLLSIILWYACTTICLNIHLFKDIWADSSFWLLQSCCEHLCTSFIWTCFHFSGIYVQEYNCWIVW